jgi:hypothetical protein
MAQRNVKKTHAAPEAELERIKAQTQLLELAKTRGIKPAETFEELLGDGGPEDETADDMIRAIYGWRRESLDRKPRSY